MPTPTRSPTAALTLRRAAAATLLAGSAAELTWSGAHIFRIYLRHPHPTLLMASLCCAAVVGTTVLAAFAMLRRSVVSQVLARGMAWFLLLPTAFALLGRLFAYRNVLHGDIGWALWMVATSGGALLLARPALHTPEARAAFAPTAYRRVFLGGAVASVAAGLATASYAPLWTRGAEGACMGLMALGASLIAAAVGVARMRGWGVLLGIATAAVSLLAAVTARSELAAIGFALAALPGMILGAPLVATRLGEPVPAHGPAMSFEALRLYATDATAGSTPALEAIRVHADEAPPCRARVGGDAHDVPSAGEMDAALHRLS